MDLRKLKDKATEAFSKGKFSKAAEFYEEYCEKDPKDLQARLRMGDAFAKSGNKPRAIQAYTSAAEGFAKEGFLPRAIAASKLILELDPAHKGVQQMLADLYARKTGKPAAGASKPAGASAVATGAQLAGHFNRKDAIDLPPDTSGDASKIETATQSAPTAQRTYDATPSPMNRKDAIELPPDDSAPADNFIEATSAPKKDTPAAIVPPPPAAAAKVEEKKPFKVEAPPPPEEISIEMEVGGSTPAPPAEAAAPAVEILEESSDQPSGSGSKVFDLSLDDTGGIDLSSELPPELQAGMKPTPAAAAKNEAKAIEIEVPEPAPPPPAPKKVEPAGQKVYELEMPEEQEPPKQKVYELELPAEEPKPAAAKRAVEVDNSDSGMELEIEFGNTPSEPPPAAAPVAAKPAERVAPPPPPAPAAAKPAPQSRIWMPTASDGEPSAPTPMPEPARKPVEYTAAPPTRKTRTDIEATLDVFSKFEELDSEPLRPAPPPPKPRAAAPPPKPPVAAPPPPPPAVAAAPPPAPPAVAAAPPPPAAEKKQRRLSFTELELEGDSLLHAVETAAQVGATQRGEATTSDDDIVYTIDDQPAPGEGLPGGELPKIPLFSDLEPEAFMELFDRCPLRRYTTGERVFEQGSIGDSFFVICAGAVKVFRIDGAERRDLATLKEGTFFGEMALLSGSPRTASVEAADDDTQLLEIGASILTELSHRYPAVAQALKKFMRQRLLSNVMNSSALFAPFSKSDRRTLVEKFRARDVQKGDVLIREGDRSDGLYILLSGEVEVKKGTQLLARLKEGEVFGEMSLLQKTPATATVQASKRTSLLRLPREHFDALILTHPQILMLVSDLTDTRKKETEALLSGNAKIGDDGLMLV